MLQYVNTVKRALHKWDGLIWNSLPLV